MEVPAGKYSSPVMIPGPSTISATILGPSIVSKSSGNLPSTFVSSISITVMDKVNIEALVSRALGPGVVIGPCTWPTEDTTVTDSNHHTTVYPQIVCRDNKRRTCCPFEETPDAHLSTCPQGYMTIGENACCPHGWSIFDTLLGTQTPCYSRFSTAVTPAATADGDTGTTTIRTALFAKKYDLITSQTARPSTPPTSSASLELAERPLSNSWRLNDREIAGVVVGSVFGALFLLGTAIVLLRRWKRRNSTPQITVDDLIRQPTNGTHEFAPTDNQYPAMQPHDELWTARTIQTANSNPHLSTAYSTEMTPTVRAIQPQELPGNTFINEYHPAYRNDPGSWGN